jgi:hypothetical protein
VSCEVVSCELGGLEAGSRSPVLLGDRKPPASHGESRRLGPAYEPFDTLWAQARRRRGENPMVRGETAVQNCSSDARTRRDRMAGRHKCLLSKRRKACRDGRLFSFYPISSVYQVGGGKHAKFLWVFWWISGLESGFITSVWGLGA